MTTPLSTLEILPTKNNEVSHSNLIDNTQDEGERFYSFPLSHSDSELSTQDEHPIESSTSAVANSSNVSQPILSSETDSKIAIPYGIDWSASVRPSSHCWFPATNDEASITQLCQYISCTEQETTDKSQILQCGSCALTIHTHHLNYFSTAHADLIPPCRPSFTDNKDNPSKDDEHFWSHVSVLPEPCTHCEHASMRNSLFGMAHNQLWMPSSSEFFDQVTSMINSLSVNFNPNMSKSSRGLVCLWCSRSYHQSCWDQLVADNNNTKCDYGIFQDIIVRPQWLSRSNESATHFKATVPLHSANNGAKANTFSYTPVLVFINKRSGGQVGEKIYRKLLRQLNPRQIFLLENNDTITYALDIYSSLPNLRICVFGGDGTVGWVLGRLAETFPSGSNPPVAICPLGTGNDLSRVLAWGEQYDSKRLFPTLLQIPLARIVTLDRWKVQLEQLDASATVSTSSPLFCETGFPIDRIFKPLFDDPKFARESNRACYENYQQLPNTRFINYMSFGLDAAIALEFHDQRTRDPSKFSSPLKNKFMYLNQSCKYFNDFARANIWNLSSYIRLICDGQDLTDSLHNCHTLVILNIPGYASGTNPWRDPLFSIGDSQTFDRQDFGDRTIEIVGLSTTHMAAIHMGFSGYRIAQCRELRIELSCPMTAQIDGEPFYLPASVAVNISHADQVLVTTNDTN